eukprot:6206301-Pleurochrysis_carterae.AAC.1
MHTPASSFNRSFSSLQALIWMFSHRDWAVVLLMCDVPRSRFVDGDTKLSESDVTQTVLRAFNAFGDNEVLKLSPLQESGVSVLELWHGPSLAFKDLGMSVLAALLSLLLRRRNGRLTLLVGTSGDTGSSAMEAVVTHGGEALSVVVLYPLRSFSNVSR